MIDFIADVAANHNGDLERCRRLIDVAAETGCAAVQFSLSRLENLYAPQILQVSSSHRQQRRQELPRHFLPHLAEWAHARDLKLGLMVFDLEMVDRIQSHADFLSISPYELPWLDLIDRAADTGLPLVLDSGMADAGETWNAVQTALEAGCTKLTVMRSVARFPTPEQNCNLASLGTAREMLVREFTPLYADADLRAGWADNSVSPGVIARAINHWGCDAVTLRLDLEGDGDSFARGGCWLPGEVGPLIAGGYLPVRRECDGNGRLAPDPGELEERGWRADPGDGLRPAMAQRKSWVASRPEARRRGPTVYLVCDSPGTEALQRCLALAECLRDDHDAEILFLVPRKPHYAGCLVRHGFKWTGFDSMATLVGQIVFLKNLAAAEVPPVCVIDTGTPGSKLVADLQEDGILTVMIGRETSGAADLRLVPTFGRCEEPDADDILEGTDYLLVPDDVAALRLRRPKGHPDARFPRVVVCFDDDDPDDRTTPMVAALSAAKAPGTVAAVLDATVGRHEVTSQILAGRFPDCTVLRTGDPVEPLLAAADLVITGPGLVAVEALCLGVPVVVMSNGENASPEAACLAETGAALNLGLLDHATDESLTEEFRKLFNDPDRLSRLRYHAQELASGPLDGHGAIRVADRISQLVRAKR